MPCAAATQESWLTVETGHTTACAIANNGSLWCWGALGANGTAVLAPSMLIDGDVISVAIGEAQACAVFANNSGEWPVEPRQALQGAQA